MLGKMIVYASGTIDLKTSIRTVVASCLLVAVACLSQPAQAARSPLINEVTIVVPGAPGGGWDITANAIKASLQQEKLVRTVTIDHFPGAGGLIGLSQFVALHRGQDNILLVGGLVMLGAVIRDEPATTLRDVSPIARLTAEWDVLVSPTESSFHSVQDLEQEMALRPSAVRWLGGPLGGPDQALVWAIAGAYREPLDEVTYYGRLGGGRASHSLLNAGNTIGVGGYAEFADKIALGSLRVLAVAAPQRISGINAPTLRESGLNVTMTNWRGVFAPPGLKPLQRARLATLIETMAKSNSWAIQLQQNRWTNNFLGADGFYRYLEQEQANWARVVNPRTEAGEAVIEVPPLAVDVRRLSALLLAVISLGGMAAWLLWRLYLRRKAAAILHRRCSELSEKLDQASASTGTLIKDGIDEDFSTWSLSTAESDIAWFMLRGLSMREIAGVRGTSERTVRQQAQAIYRKAGLDGRSDLAGRVLERFI